MSTINTGQQGQVQQEQRRGDGPVNISPPKHLTAFSVSNVGHVLMVVLGRGAAEARDVARGHGEVAEGGGDGDQGGNDMVEALGDGDVP